MKTLPPQILTKSYWASVEKQLKWIFFDIVFAPILAIIQGENAQPIELKNAGGSLTALLVALRTGRVQYQQGVFSGHFSVAISNDIRSFGGTFDSRTKTYRCDSRLIPEIVKSEAANYSMNAKAAHEQILRKLNEIQDRLDDRLMEYNVDPYDAIERIEGGFRKSAQALQVAPKLDAYGREQLAREYNHNIKLYIKNFSQESIGQLREAVEDNSMQGYRFDKLQGMIKQRYGATANKAKFLARQETSLFMSKYRQQRFTTAGVRMYRWSTSHDERVRDDHKRLNGRIFSYASPPVTDRHTGAKNNPGEDYNCRCLDLPVLDKVAEYV